jgi:hypothetical protein
MSGNRSTEIIRPYFFQVKKHAMLRKKYTSVLAVLPLRLYQRPPHTCPFPSLIHSFSLFFERTR